jgi:hypothetical protein
MAAGLGAGGAVGIALEPTAAPGTWVTPAIWVPVKEENFSYNEDRYFSDAIRQQTISQAAKQGYYHIEGNLNMEVDTRTLPYFLHASRLGVTKTGAGSPWTYKYQPSTGAQIPATNRTCSITILRNGQWFGYAGCVVGSFDIMVDGGVLMLNITNLLGTTDVPQATITASPPTPTFTTPQLLGANAHSLALGDGALASGAAGVAAMASTTVSTKFNGFTFTDNENAEAQNRINQLRSAAYISFGITEAQIAASLDFDTRVDYDHFVATDSKRFQFISSNSASDKVVINVYNSVFEEYPVSLGGWGDIIMADAVLRVLSSGGTNPGFDINVLSTTDLVVT